MAPVVAAAALTAAANLMQGLMAQEAAKKQAMEQAREEARKRLDQAQRQQISLAGQAAQNEGGALNNLMQALRATAR